MEQLSLDHLLIETDNCAFSLIASISAGADDVVAVPPSADIPADSVLKSALAGGLSCALSAALMHPVDTYKVKICLQKQYKKMEPILVLLFVYQMCFILEGRLNILCLYT